jgi:hypothetical protein
VASTLSGLFESLHNFQVEIFGFPPIPTGLFWMFSCQYIFLYFQVHFGALNNVYFPFHSQTVDELEFDDIMCISQTYLSNMLSHT